MKKLSYGLIAVLILVLAIIYVVWPESETEVLLPPPVAEATTSRITTEGEYVGFMDRFGARAWLGIPYAKPPIEELRWRAPITPARHAGIKEAITFGDMCIQPQNPIVRSGDATGEGIVGSEDCLTLNIWSPANSTKSPVMFWIHGGGNSIGEAATYNGAKLASSQKVVVVTINYRLGVLGWFNHPHVLAANDQSSGNFGTLDIIRALEWVRDNIRSFGGDPDNVTIFSESAGGFNVLSLLATTAAEGLFHRAISQSGGFSTTDPAHGTNLESDGGHTNSAFEITKRLLIQSKEASNESEAIELLDSWEASKTARFLQEAPAAAIYATLGTQLGGMLNFPALFADNVTAPSGKTEDIFGNNSVFNEVPIILGTNRDEPTLFMMQSPEHLDSILGFIPTLKDENDYRRAVYYGGQAWKVRGVDSIATAMRQAGHEDVFAYRFDWDEEESVFFFDLSVALGAGHAIEIPFVFGDFTSLGMLSGYFPNNDAQFNLSNSMMSYWGEFAHSGDPGNGRSGNETTWSRFGDDQKTSIVFDTESDGGIRMIDELVTYESLREELVADKSFNDHDLFCRTFVTTIGGTDAFDQSDFEKVGCGHIDPSEVDWF